MTAPTPTPRTSASWIIRNRFTKAVVCETFSADFVHELNAASYEAVPILEYLQSLNAKDA